MKSIPDRTQPAHWNSKQQLDTSHGLPIILDTSHELVESVEFDDGYVQDQGGLLGRANVQAALLSMSGYGKHQSSDATDYESSRPLQDSMYLAYAQPGFAQPHVSSSSLSYPRETDQVPYAANALFQPRAQFEDTQLSFPNIPTQRSRQIPEVTSCTPQLGPQGTQIFVNLASAYDVEAAQPALEFYVMFASRRCQSLLTKLESQGNFHQYMLTVNAPLYSTTGWTGSQVPLRLHVQNPGGSNVGVIDVGTFTYTDAMHQAPHISSPEVSRKRKVSMELGDTLRVPAKRTSHQQLRSSESDTYDAQADLQQPVPSYLSQSSYTVDPSAGSLMPPYNRSQSQMSYQQRGSPRRVSQHLSTSSGSSISQMRGPSPQTPSWSPSNAPIHQPSKSPNLSAPSVTRVSSASSPSTTAHPTLIRTSTLQHSPSPAATPSANTGASSFNPYAMYPQHKAILKINGDLDAMANSWTKEESEVKRRLVQFWRSQSGSTINTTFKPVAPENRQPNSICISCIWWESKKECYVTSVDTIYLLESLVAVRFTVEEKNRIRRNLEGFRPMTVSKGKSDSEDFFKLIMQFPNPKPRNIEKDVKVFPWKILAHALKKIIGKYSASYSSTASAIPTAVAQQQQLSHHHHHQGSDLSLDLLTDSPRPGSQRSTSGVYAPSLRSGISPDISHARLSVPYSSAAPTMLQVSVPTMSSYPAAMPYPYQPQNPMGSSTSGSTAMMAQPRQTSWDYGAFLDTSDPAVGQPMPQQGLYYGRYDEGPEEAGQPQYQLTNTSSAP